MRKILAELMAFNRAGDSTVPFASEAERQGLPILILSAGHRKAIWCTQVRSLEPGRFDAWFVGTDVFTLIL